MSIVFDTEKFIAIVQRFPTIWDKGMKDYADKIKRKGAWKLILREFYGEDYDSFDDPKKSTLLKDAQTKWKSVRNSFARELAKRKAKPSGSARQWKTYTNFEQLSFLIPSMSNNEVESNLSVGDPQPTEDDGDRIIIDDEDETETTSVDETSRNTSSRKRKRNTTDNDDLAAVLVESLKWRQEKEERLENDPDKLFLLSLLDDLKNVPKVNKSRVKTAIIDAINSGTYTECPHNVPPHRANAYPLLANFTSHLPYHRDQSASQPIPSYYSSSFPIHTPPSRRSMHFNSPLLQHSDAFRSPSDENPNFSTNSGKLSPSNEGSTASHQSSTSSKSSNNTYDVLEIQ